MVEMVHNGVSNRRVPEKRGRAAIEMGPRQSDHDTFVREDKGRYKREVNKSALPV